MKKVLFIKNAVVLTATALILRIVGIFFRVWLADSIGAEGMGLYQMIFSVYVLASTFATSGISTAVTRMITERLSVEDKFGAKKVLKISCALSLLLAAITTAIIIVFSDFIGEHLVGDTRSVLGIKILCLGLPLMGVCSCLRGYFLARRSAIPPSVCQIAEQMVRMGLIVFLVNKYAHLGLGATCGAVLAGDCIAEGVGTVILWAIYKWDFKNILTRNKALIKGRTALKEIIRISVPISSGRYLHTGLRTAESLITPSCLVKYSASKTTALEQFGMVKGMALPLLLFPASLLSSISTLLVPEMSENLVSGNMVGIKNAVEKIFYITSVVSFLVAGIFFTASYQIGQLVYASESVGYLLRALSPLIPFMYIDLIADGILKGLDKQSFLFASNVSDSAIRVILVLFFVSKFGMIGFLGVMFFSNIYTSVLAVIKISKTVGLHFNMQKIFFIPLFASFFASAITDFLCKKISANYILYVAVSSTSIFVLYFVFLTIFGGINLQKIKNTKGLIITKKRKSY